MREAEEAVSVCCVCEREIERKSRKGKRDTQKIVIQENIEKDLKNTQKNPRRSIYIRKKTEENKEKERKKPPPPTPIIAIPKMVKVTRTNISITVQRSCHKKCSHSAI